MEHTELFAFMREYDFADALAVLKSESPHTLSVVLSCMEAEHAAAVLQALGAEAQNAVVPLIAEGERIPRAVAESIASDIEEKLRAEQKRHCFSIGGAARAAELLNLIDRGSEKRILQHIEQSRPALFETLRHHLFAFEDIVLLSDRAVQKVLRETETHCLAAALKGADDGVREKILRNMSKRAIEYLNNEAEFMGAVSVKDVEAARTDIVNIIVRLEEAGEILIAHEEAQGEKQ